MFAITSNLENRESNYDPLNAYLKEHGFTLGGNWEYDHGYFDRGLDGDGQGWLRLPFQVVHGEFNGDTEDSDAVVRLGTPFVLQRSAEKADADSGPAVAGSLVNQFREPEDKDIPVDERWIGTAAEVLRAVEQGFPA